MLNFIIKAIFGFKSVDSVMSQFHKTIEQLEQVSTENSVLASQKLDQSALLVKQANEHLAEVKKSNIIQSKLAALFHADGQEFTEVDNVVNLRNENSAFEKVMAK